MPFGGFKRVINNELKSLLAAITQQANKCRKAYNVDAKQPGGMIDL